MKRFSLILPVILLMIRLLTDEALAQTLYLVADTIKHTITIKVPSKSDFIEESDSALGDIRVASGLRFDVSKLDTKSEVHFYSTPDAATSKEIATTGPLIRRDGYQYTFQKTDPKVSIIKITVKLPGADSAVSFTDIGANLVQPPPKTDSSSYASWRDYLANNRGGYVDIIKGRQRYFSNKDVAYICLDPFGNIIGKKPVNMDEDDEIIILMVIPYTTVFDDYSINDNDAKYAPDDLSILPSPVANVTNSGKKEELKYTVKVFDKGPYSSGDVTFTAMRQTTILSNTTVHINPLYHLRLAVSYVSSSLESPDYQVVPLTGTTNTIKAVTGGRRTFLTVNAIWYWWSTLRYLRGSDITHGRDVLKEPDLLTRLNPTFGVSLKGEIESNFFAGFNFEFARGGSISAGWHYGRVTSLLDRDFNSGVTEFTGQQADIKTFQHWKWGGFFGITLDTRIFNGLFSSSKSGNP